MTDFKITKKEAIENLKQKAKDAADKGDIAAAAECNAQRNTIRAKHILQQNSEVVKRNFN